MKRQIPKLACAFGSAIKACIWGHLLDDDVAEWRGLKEPWKDTTCCVTYLEEIPMDALVQHVVT